MLGTKKKTKCCCGCAYFSAFASGTPGPGQKLLSDALGVEITVDSGDWDIDSFGRLRVIGPGRIILEPSQPHAESRYALRYESGNSFGFGDSEAENTFVRLYIDWLDSANHHYAEGWTFLEDIDEIPSGKIVRVNSGVETELSDTHPDYWRNIPFPPFFFYGGTICIQGGTVNASGPDWGVDTPIATRPTTPVGGYKAAIEVIQAEGFGYTFTSIMLFKMGGDDCPTASGYCGGCFATRGCQSLPAGGFLVTLDGVGNGTDDSSRSYCSNGASNFNGSFTCDQFVFVGLGQNFGTGMDNPGSATGLATGWFELSPDATCRIRGMIGGPVDKTFTHGRVILEPVGDSGSPTFGNEHCTTGFKLHLMLSDNSGFFLNEYYAGRIAPSGTVSVGFVCESIEETEFSGGGSEKLFDLTGASFTVEAL